MSFINSQAAARSSSAPVASYRKPGVRWGSTLNANYGHNNHNHNNNNNNNNRYEVVHSREQYPVSTSTYSNKAWLQNVGKIIVGIMIVFGFLAIICALMSADQEEYAEKARKERNGAKDDAADKTKRPARMDKFINDVRQITKPGPEARLARILDEGKDLIEELPREEPSEADKFADRLYALVKGPGTTVDDHDGPALNEDDEYTLDMRTKKRPDPRASKHWKTVVDSQTQADQKLMRFGVGLFQEMFPRTGKVATAFLPELETTIFETADEES